MRYLPHTQDDIQVMLKEIGVSSIEELFSSIPGQCRRKSDLNLGEPCTEWELNSHMRKLAKQMPDWDECSAFLGAGNYEHYIPASIQHLLQRSELYTSYTPYQPEISQGTLQSIFEYQTLVSGLLGMEVSNASMYDGASALAEALFMSLRISRRKSSVAISRAINPLYREVVRTYLQPSGFRILELPCLENGRTDLGPLQGEDDLAAVALQSPNFFGCIEDLDSAQQKIHDAGALAVTCFSEALAYGLLKPPGTLGADIVCGEGQSLGISQSYGGPGLGIFCTRKKYTRNMPGRLVGQTRDKNETRGFVLTLATREQHIRREKATSNICSNQGLCATTAAMYLASLGGTGIRELAELNRDKTEYLKENLLQAGCSIPFSSPTFNEFVVGFPSNFDYDNTLNKGIIPGIPLGQYYPELDGHYLLCVTETKNREELDNLVKEVSK
ncbi:MAG: aminomethyl-transferring glycine dehydrogenase subunit GcvPA [Thermodesulfobacteriota bacterium]